MKVKTWVETAQEVEVEVSISEVMLSIAELADSDQVPMLLSCVSSVHATLREIPASQIERMTDKQRTIIADRLREQAARFAAPSGDGATAAKLSESGTEDASEALRPNDPELKLTRRKTGKTAGGLMKEDESISSMNLSDQIQPPRSDEVRECNRTGG